MIVYYAATRCRDSSVRRNAIAILRSRPSKNGVWNSLQVARVAEWGFELEEKGQDENGFISENCRIRMHTLKWSSSHGYINVECVQGTGEEGSKFQTAALSC